MIPEPAPISNADSPAYRETDIERNILSSDGRYNFYVR
jgi:hypothetical protein